ncbi:hypothetical protein E4U59_003991 [Claviceps monticola]|nr:hypothetical protein E4U59_003991 [Claviceps monticola]
MALLKSGSLNDGKDTWTPRERSAFRKQPSSSKFSLSSLKLVALKNPAAASAFTAQRLLSPRFRNILRIDTLHAASYYTLPLAPQDRRRGRPWGGSNREQLPCNIFRRERNGRIMAIATEEYRSTSRYDIITS